MEHQFNQNYKTVIGSMIYPGKAIPAPLKYLLCVSLLLLIGSGAMAQYYTRDAGLRVGEGVFVSYRQFLHEDMALEGQIGISKDGFKVAGLREYSHSLSRFNSESLRLFYGYGIHLGIDYTNNYKTFSRTVYHNWMWNPKFGVDGLIGVEFLASELPFMVSAAMQPYFEFSLNQYFRLKPFNFVVSFKYRF